MHISVLLKEVIDYLEKINYQTGVTINKQTTVTKISRLKNYKFRLNYLKGDDKNLEEFDMVISTAPTQVLVKLGADLLPKQYIDKLNGIKYLHALVLVLETDKSILDKTYWLNICTESVPMMVLVQHTNFVDKKYYGGKHIAYIGYYLKQSDRLLKKSKQELIDYLTPYLSDISTNKFIITDSYRFVGPYAQAIFDKEFPSLKPDYITPIKNFFIANLDMTYPYDRGTNFAVKMGREVANLVQSSK